MHDDGSGPALYVGGPFITASGMTVNHIARWDGTSWSALGGGMGSTGVFALGMYDDGGGPTLYAGGSFVLAGGVRANRIASWNGSSWAATGTGIGNTVSALSFYDDGSGPALYAGGYFLGAGGVAAKYVAKRDGESWEPLGAGMDR